MGVLARGEDIWMVVLSGGGEDIQVVVLGKGGEDIQVGVLARDVRIFKW